MSASAGTKGQGDRGTKKRPRDTGTITPPRTIRHGIHRVRVMTHSYVPGVWLAAWQVGDPVKREQRAYLNARAARQLAAALIRAAERLRAEKGASHRRAREREIKRRRRIYCASCGKLSDRGFIARCWACSAEDER